MPSCVVKCCKNNTQVNNKSGGITFHTFPLSIPIRNEWLAAIRQSRNEPQWEPSISSVVCSDHFDKTDRYDIKSGRCRLTKTAYPKQKLFPPSDEIVGNIKSPSISSPYVPTTSAASSDTSRGSGHQAKKRKREILKPFREDSSSKTSDASVDNVEQAGPSAAANQHRCCCCLFADGFVALAGGMGPITYATMLKDCFNITYPDEVLSTLAICLECIDTLADGVRFKQKVLECQTTMATYRRNDTLPVQVKDEVTTEPYNVDIIEEDSTTIKEEPEDIYTDSVQVQNNDASAQNDILHARTNFLDKIKEEYNLSENGEGYESRADIEKPIEPNEHMNTPLFKEQEPDILAQVERLTTEEEAYFEKGCKCDELCHQKFSRFEVVAFRRECEKYQTHSKCDEDHMDIFLTGALACSYDQSVSNSEASYKFRDVPICEDFFNFVFVLNTPQYSNILMKTRHRATYQWHWQAPKDKPVAVKFLKAYSTQNSLVLPGRFTNKHPDLHILPRNMTKHKLYSIYTQACVAAKTKFITQTLWDKVWDNFCPYILFKMPSHLCKICRESAKCLSISGVLNKGLQSQELQRCLKHLQIVSDESDFYERSIVKRASPTASTLHFYVDFLQRIRLPHDPTSGHINFLDAYGVALLAVASRPPGETVVYVVPECVGDDTSNILLSLLHHFLESNGTRDVQWHCGPLLRAHCVLQYAAWRAARAAGRCRLAFLPPGHDRVSKLDCLTLLKVALRNRPAVCVQDLCEVLDSIGVVPIPVAYEDGLLKVPMYNWLEFFGTRNCAPVLNIQDYCHFQADSSNIGEIQCKVSVNSEAIDIQSVFPGGSLEGEPKVLPAVGITPERHSYLYEKIRPHLDESVRDVLYPKDLEDPLELKTEMKMEFEEHIV